MSDNQAAIDTCRNTMMNSLDEAAVTAAELTHDLLSQAHRLDLYCPSHRENHRIGVAELEDLIYGLVGDRADQRCESEPHPGCEDKPGWQEVAEWCPLDDLSWMRDGETYGEHIEDWVDARRQCMATNPAVSS